MSQLGAKNEWELVLFGADVVTSTIRPYAFTAVMVKVSIETLIVKGGFHTGAILKALN